MIKAILIDDEIAAIEMMQAHIAELREPLKVCATCLTIDQAVESIRQYEPDIILLDIELGEGLGFEVLERVPDTKAQVIFVTAYDHYAIKAIKYHAFDYLLKPVVAAELHSAIQKAIAACKASKPVPDTMALLEFLKSNIAEKIAVPDRNGLSYYRLDEIVFVEAHGSYVLLHLQGKASVLVSKPLKSFEQSLTHKGFMRVHKSFLVNLQHIVSLHRDEGGYLQMSNLRQVPISPKEKDAVIERIKQVSNIV